MLNNSQGDFTKPAGFRGSEQGLPLKSQVQVAEGTASLELLGMLPPNIFAIFF